MDSVSDICKYQCQCFVTLIQVNVIEDIDLKFGTHIHQTMLCNIYSFFILILMGNFLQKKTTKNVDFFEAKLSVLWELFVEKHRGPYGPHQGED